MHERSDVEIQARYARIAGFVYLLLIVLFMGGQSLISHVEGTGDFAQRLHLRANSLLLGANAGVLPNCGDAMFFVAGMTNI
ncbi:hypothetical protein [Dokdonella soli]|uniref:hypothetical protein n=1 Tax=Dokdonella soli TaxID=529810 RepID=UPI0031D5EFAB